VADQRTGKVLQGRYKVLSPLAEGGMGIVYRAERVGIGRPVVVKFLHAVLTDQPGIVDRFEREARATAKLNHPNCVQLVDYGIEDGSPYLVMEYVEGKTLADLLDFGALPPRRAVTIARQVLAGLAHAHERGILHRDLKPANIMLIDAVGCTDFVKILDFGLAKLLGTPDGGKRDVTVQGIAIGTPGYMSPEQAAGVPSDRRADIYCTGALLYHLVTGSKAFEGDDIHSVLRRHREETPMAPRELKPAAAISKELERCIERAMLREPSKRYQTAEEMMEALRATPEGRTIADEVPGDKKAKPPAQTPSGSDVETRAEMPASRRGQKKQSSSSSAGIIFGMVVGAAATVALALYTPIGGKLVSATRRSGGAGAVNVKPIGPAAPGGSGTGVGIGNLAGKSSVPVPVAPVPVAPVVPEPEIVGVGGLATGKDKDVVAPIPKVTPDAGPAVASAVPEDTDDDQAPAVKAEDGSNEDDRAPPPEAPAAPHREMPQVRSIADVKALLKKGDADGALAGLFRLRKQRPNAQKGADIAALIGHLYFDRKWWTDALKEYRFACRLDPRAKNDGALVANTVRTLGDRGTYWRARRLILDHVGRTAVPALRAAVKNGPTPDAKRRAKLVLDTLEGKGARRAKR
jgi:eukaryotic-like serine/threonine-protein kinase